jgi:hypothetical protein
LKEAMNTHLTRTQWPSARVLTQRRGTLAATEYRAAKDTCNAGATYNDIHTGNTLHSGISSHLYTLGHNPPTSKNHLHQVKNMGTVWLG